MAVSHRRTRTLDRGDVDDTRAPDAGFGHLIGEELHQSERTLDVGREHRGHVVRGYPLEVGNRLHGGIVDEYRRRTEGLPGLLDQVLTAFAGRQVGADRPCLQAVLLELGHEFERRALCPSVMHGHFRTVPREASADRTADAATAAGYDRNLPMQHPRRHVLPP
jgi:hypothetical protein